MKLYTTLQVAQMTNTPYRALLDWVEEGIFKPSVVGGNTRRVILFDEGDVWEVRAFNEIRSRFDQTEWPLLTKAIREMRRRHQASGYLAGMADPGSATIQRYKFVQKDEIEDLLKTGALILLIALGVAALGEAFGGKA